MSSRFRSPGAITAVFAVSLAAVGSLDSGSSWAKPTDPNLPQRITVGVARGSMPMPRVDPTRRSRSRVTLPRSLGVEWRTRVPGQIDRGIAVGEGGSIVVATSAGQILQLDAAGKVEWTFRTGSGAATTDPVITADGARGFVTSGNEWITVEPNGKERYRVALPSGSVRDVLPTADGGAVLAIGRELLRFERDGMLRSRARGGNTMALLADRTDTVIVTVEGTVSVWRSVNVPTTSGRLGGRATGGIALHDRRVFAIVDASRVVTLDLDSHELATLVGNGTHQLSNSLALGSGGQLTTVTDDGVLLRHDRRGKEVLRVALEPLDALADAGSRSRVSGPPLIVDSSGTAAFVRPGLDVGVVLGNGELRAGPNSACGEPVGLSPTGRDGIAIACRAGIVVRLSAKRASTGDGGASRRL